MPSAAVSSQAVCASASKGYSILGGQLVKCDPLCVSCQSYLPSVCTACYPGYLLSHGSCSRCLDPNALTCSLFNASYSLTCTEGYTATFWVNVNATGGMCLACGQYCKKCDVGGPGGCDSNGCEEGTVQLVGTANCSLCFGGCARCSGSNPNLCLECGVSRYLSAGGCLPCQVGCVKCTSGSSCLGCGQGYLLANSSCFKLGANCVGINASSGLCTECFGGYVLNASTAMCEADLSCNSTGSCTICPEGYYLGGTSCFQCQVGANCVSCGSYNATLCTSCGGGYYLDSSSNCQNCPANCLSCGNSYFCTQAAQGYYIAYQFSPGVRLLQGISTFVGVVAQCDPTCATCAFYAHYCLTCTSGFTLLGSTCRSNDYLHVSLLLGQAAKGDSIFGDGADPNLQVFNSLKDYNRLGNALDMVVPGKLKDGRPWNRRFHFISISAGSVRVVMLV
jgi:hypothetical protein